MTERWRWPKPAALAILVLFLTIDLAFFGANALKIMQGGWVTLAVALALFTLMTTWKTGRQIVSQRLTARAVPLEDFMARVAESRPTRVPGTAVFMTARDLPGFEELKSSQQGQMIVVRAMDGRVQFWNKGAERLYGWRDEEVLGEPISQIL